MSHDFLVLHYDWQCPWTAWAIDQAREAARVCGGRLEVRDVAKQPELAQRYRLFFPFLTIIDERTRISAPTPAGILAQIARDEASLSGETAPTAEPDADLPTADAVPERVVPLVPANVTEACALCNAPDGGCSLKGCFSEALAPTLPGGLLGFVAYNGTQPLAAVEALPAALVPYPLPTAREDAVFITCVYPTCSPDYRGATLDRLVAELPRLGYRRALVVAGRHTPFPNGPTAFFARHGFREVCELPGERLRDTVEQLVLMELTI